jgi:hypothetical protein
MRFLGQAEEHQGRARSLRSQANRQGADLKSDVQRMNQAMALAKSWMGTPPQGAAVDENVTHWNQGNESMTGGFPHPAAVRERARGGDTGVSARLAPQAPQIAKAFEAIAQALSARKDAEAGKARTTSTVNKARGQNVRAQNRQSEGKRRETAAADIRAAQLRVAGRSPAQDAMMQRLALARQAGLSI